MIDFRKYCYMSVFVWCIFAVAILLSKTNFKISLLIVFTLQALFHLIMINLVNTPEKAIHYHPTLENNHKKCRKQEQGEQK